MHIENEIQIDYKVRINRVFEYIDANLDGALTLKILADIAFFSPFHFHRVFKSITGETLNDYVIRRRIEKSASDLMHKHVSLSTIYRGYGFPDNSSFTRAFKKFYGASPTAFKKENPNKFSKIRQIESKNGQIYPDFEKYICIIDNLKKWILMNAKIEIKEIEKLNLAYVPSIGTRNLEATYQKLVRWAGPKGLLDDNTKMVTIYHDSLLVTEADKARLDACLVLTKPVAVDGEFGLTSIEQGKFIVGSFEIGIDEFEKSWTGLFVWMHEHGYKKADRHPFELYHNNFNEHPEKRAKVDFYIPID